MGANTQTGLKGLYDNHFYSALGDVGIAPTEAAFRVILELFPGIGSCVDVGCGIGTWLTAATRLGVADILGVDGPWVPPEHRRIPEESFLCHDLSAGWPSIGRRFSLAMTTEVAEHFPPERADSFICLLCSLSDIVAFSAAIPGQMGTNHLNEQWPEYWAEKFRANGYTALDALRFKLMPIDGLPSYYKQNMFLAVKNELYDPRKFEGISTHILGMVHPDRATIRHQLRSKRYYTITRPLRGFFNKLWWRD